MKMAQLTVAVTYQDDRAGRRRLAYADDLASRCGAELFLALLDTPLVPALAAAAGRVAGASAPAADRYFAALASSLHQCRTADIAGLEGDWTALAAALASRADAVAVSDRPERHFAGLAAIYPADETEFSRNRDGPPRVLVPFGTGPDAADALEGLVAVLGPMAAKEVVLYHTTWRNPSIASDDPDRHVCPEAAAVRTALEARLDRLGWPYRTVIETAEAVPAGIAQRALGELCSLICMARSPHVVKGSYVDELLARTAVPLLTVAERRIR